MKRMQTVAIAIAVLSVSAASPSLAQKGMGGGSGRMYDPNTVETVSGQVVKVEQVVGKGRAYGCKSCSRPKTRSFLSTWDPAGISTSRT